MRNPRLTSKRLLSAFLVAGLAATAVVSLATSSNAATVPAMTITPATGSTAGGDTLVIKGKGLEDANNDSVVKSVVFSTVACADGTPNLSTGFVNLSPSVAGLTVASATQATLVISAVTLPAGTGYICLFNSVVGTAGTVVGSAKYVVGVAPAITFVNAVADATTTVHTASTFGGTVLSLTGTDFTKKAVVKVSGVTAKTTYVSATSLTAIVPAGTAGVGKAIKVTTEYGSDTSVGHTVTYLGSAKVLPIAGAASTAVGVTLTGSGFNSLSFAAAAAIGNSVIQFSPGGVAVAGDPSGGGAGDVIATTKLCTNIVVVSDTELSCLTPANLTGPYSVQIFTRDPSAVTKVGVINTVVTRNSTYTAAAF